MIKNCQAGLAITRSAVSPRQDKSLRFFSSLLSLCEPLRWDMGDQVGLGSAPQGGRAEGTAVVVEVVSRLRVAAEASGDWGPHEPSRRFHPSAQRNLVSVHLSGHTCWGPWARAHL